VGTHYGWPWFYWGKNEDNRVYDKTPQYQAPEFLIDYVRKPEYALGPHVAPLGLAFATGGGRLGEHYANGAFIARHGSWNRRPPVGYDVVFVRFDANGNPQGLPEPVLTGFLKADGDTHGRPTWVSFAQDGALLVSDDTGGIVWRLIAPGADPRRRAAQGGNHPHAPAARTDERPRTAISHQVQAGREGAAISLAAPRA
jgi:glucose/arabinose dehydrogenase